MPWFTANVCVCAYYILYHIAKYEYLHTYKHTLIHICIAIYIYICTCTHIHRHFYKHTHIYYIYIYIYIDIYGSFHVRTTSKNWSYLSNPFDVGMWGVLYDITLHAKRNVSSTFSYQDILTRIFDLWKTICIL